MVTIVGRSEPVLAISSSRDTGEIIEATFASPEAITNRPEAIHTSQTDNNSSNITVVTADNRGHKNIEVNVKPLNRCVEDAINPIT